jgi:hypothetical protein
MRRVSWASTRASSRLAGDLVEHHAVHGNLGLQHLEEVPGDRFALAVFISCEIEFVGAGERLLQLGHRLLLRVGDDVVGLELVLDVDGELSERALLEFGGQVLGLDEVADVSDRSHHVEALAQVLGDRLHLRRRLDDDELSRAGQLFSLYMSPGGRRASGVTPCTFAGDDGHD